MRTSFRVWCVEFQLSSQSEVFALCANRVDCVDAIDALVSSTLAKGSWSALKRRLNGAIPILRKPIIFRIGRLLPLTLKDVVKKSGKPFLASRAQRVFHEAVPVPVAGIVGLFVCSSSVASRRQCFGT